MRINILAYTAITLVLSIFIFSGCKKKDDGGSGSGGGGSSYTNADYAGTWTVTDGCCSVGGSFQITITATGSNSVSISNFRKCAAPGGWNLTGTVSGNKLTIPSQNVVSGSQGGPYQFSGTGTLNSKTSLSISYVMADGSGGFPQNCTATSTK